MVVTGAIAHWWALKPTLLWRTALLSKEIKPVQMLTPFAFYLLNTPTKRAHIASERADRENIGCVLEEEIIFQLSS